MHDRQLLLSIVTQPLPKEGNLAPGEEVEVKGGNAEINTNYLRRHPAPKQSLPSYCSHKLTPSFSTVTTAELLFQSTEQQSLLEKSRGTQNVLPPDIPPFLFLIDFFWPSFFESKVFQMVSKGTLLIHNFKMRNIKVLLYWLKWRQGHPKLSVLSLPLALPCWPNPPPHTLIFPKIPKLGWPTHSSFSRTFRV